MQDHVHVIAKCGNLGIAMRYMSFVELLERELLEYMCIGGCE